MEPSHTLPRGAGKTSFDLIDASVLNAVLPVKPGAVVIDLACGRGAYAMFLSKTVGETGVIYAVDVWEQGLLQLEEQKKKKGIANIHTLLTDATQNIEIDAYSADICLMATVLHDFEETGQSDTVLGNVKTLIKPGGCLAVIEFKKTQGPPGPPVQVRLSENDVETRVTQHGFVKDRTLDIGEYNYLMTFSSP